MLRNKKTNAVACTIAAVVTHEITEAAVNTFIAKFFDTQKDDTDDNYYFKILSGVTGGLIIGRLFETSYIIIIDSLIGMAGSFAETKLYQNFPHYPKGYDEYPEFISYEKHPFAPNFITNHEVQPESMTQKESFILLEYEVPL